MEKKKKETTINDIIPLVLRCLNIQEMYNACMVCKSWLVFGQNEIKSRGPIGYLETIKKNSDQTVLNINKKIIESCRIKPTLYIFLTDHNSVKDIIRNNCHCKILPYSCYILSLRNRFLKNDTNILSGMIFPKNSSIEVFTYTFMSFLYEKKFCCPELIHTFNSDFKSADHLKYVMEKFLVTTRSTTCCMILFSNKLGYYQLLEEIVCLHKWFPDSRVPIWGGVIDTLSVCKSFLLKTQCNMRADLINIIISGQNMSMWNLLLDDDCHSKKKLKKKFAELKNNVKLKDHTIGFIFTPIKRYEKLNTLESTVFAKYFPEVQLIHIYGHAAFIGNGFKELYDMMTKQLPMEDEGCTTIMILTYY